MGKTTMTWLAIFPPVKGIILGTVVVGVIQSGLSPFAQAMIVAITSAVIGAVGVILAAYIATSEARKAKAETDEIKADVKHVKHALNIDKREDD